MLKNYLVVALRKIKRNKLYASLNILGLAVGLASFFVIYLFVQNELSYDGFHEKSDRIYRVLEKDPYSPETKFNAGLNAALAKEAASTLPDIEGVSRVETWSKQALVSGIKDSMQVFTGYSVDEDFDEIFDIEYVRGDKSTSFKSPKSLIISEKLSERLFQGDAIGRVFKVGSTNYTVDGVYKDFPKNSSFMADALFPFETAMQWRKESFTSWNSSYFDQTFFLLKEGTNIDAFEEKLNALYLSHYEEGDREVKLQSLSDVHFSIGLNDSLGQKTDRQYIYIFSAVALFILVCSFMNYISLSIAQSFERAKEIGVRKVLGANKKSIYRQFLAESILVMSTACILAIVLVEVFIPSFETIISRELATSVKSSWQVWLQVFGLVAVTTLLSTSYPAFMASKSKVAELLKNGSLKHTRQVFIEAFTVVQVVVFMILISVTFVFNRQMHFMQNENLGFDKENQIYISPFRTKLPEFREVLTNEFLKIPNVEAATSASSIPSRVMGSSRFKGYDFDVFNFNIDENYLDAMGMELIDGRNFVSTDRDSSNIILLNQAAADAIGFGNEAVGKIFDVGGIQLRVVGVVSDFHFMSKMEPIKPVMFKLIRPNEGLLMIKLSGDDMLGTINNVKAKYAQITGEEMNLLFLEDQIASQYQQEKVMITMINVFTVLAAVVAFLGLFGIAGYSVKKRIKEMGIRKVLGADFISIQKTLNISNIKKLTLAVLIAVPLIIYWVNNWLASFAYQIDLPVELIAIALVLAFLVIISTVLVHSIRAYFINPVEVLKDE